MCDPRQINVYQVESCVCVYWYGLLLAMSCWKIVEKAVQMFRFLVTEFEYDLFGMMNVQKLHVHKCMYRQDAMAVVQ